MLVVLKKRKNSTKTSGKYWIRLPRREYLIDEGKESHVLICGLATMLYGFAYDFRTASGEANVESSWTISILSPLLSWLDECKDLEQAMVSCEA